MAELVVQSCGFGDSGGGEEENGAGQLMEAGKLARPVAHWRPASRPPASYLETSLDDLSYSSDDNSSTTDSSAATAHAFSRITPEQAPNNNNDDDEITDQKPNHFLPNDPRCHHDNNPNSATDAELGSRQSADDAVERRLMEQIQSEQEALHQEQPASQQLLIMQNHQRQQQQHQQNQQQQQQQQQLERREADLCQQVREIPHHALAVGSSSFQRRSQKFQQQAAPHRQRYNTFGRPHPPEAADLSADEHPPAVPVRRSSRAASRRSTQANERPTARNQQPPSIFRRPSRSPPPPPTRHNKAAAKQAEPSSMLSAGMSGASRQGLWSPTLSSCSGGASPVSDDTCSLNNLNALASNSTGEAARTLADCSTPSPQSTVVEGHRGAQRRLNEQLSDERPPVAAAERIIEADLAAATQLDECPETPPLAASAGAVPPLKQKPVVEAGESGCSNRLRSRSVVSLQRGLTGEAPSSAESEASNRRLINQPQPQPHQQQQQQQQRSHRQQSSIMRSFSLAAPTCLASNSQMQMLYQHSNQQQEQHQQVELESDEEECKQQSIGCQEEDLQMEESGACKYWTLPSARSSNSNSNSSNSNRQPHTQVEATRDAQLNGGYAVVDRGHRKSSTGKQLALASGVADQQLLHKATKSGPPHTDTTCQGDDDDANRHNNKQNNAIARHQPPEENPFPARLCESCSPPASATCANLCQPSRFRASRAADSLAMALMPSHHHHQQQPAPMRTGDARQQQQQHPLPAPSSRIQDEWLRSMYRQMHRPSAENRHLKALNSAQQQQQQQHQELPVRIQLKGEAATAYPPAYSPTSDSDSFDAPFNRRSHKPSESPQPSSGTVSDHLSAETSHERNLSLYYKLIKHIDHAFSSVLTDVNSRSSHTLQAPRRSRSTKLQRNTSKSGPQTPVAGRSSNDQSSSIRVGGYNWPLTKNEQHERRCVFSQLLKEDNLTTTTTKLPLKDTCEPPLDEADQHKQYLAVQAGCDIPLKGLRKPAPPGHKDHMFSEESVHIHYRTPTGKLLKMNTLNEFELNRLKKLYGKQVASGCPIERSKSSWLSSAHPPASGSSRHYKGSGGGLGEDTSMSPFVDLHRYQRAFLQATRTGSRGAGLARTTDGRESVRFGRALFDFQAKSGGELSLRRGDLVELIELSDHAWAKVEDCQSGLRGLVPLNYIDYSVGCAVAKRDVTRHRGPTRLSSTIANEPAHEQHLLPMSKGEPITLIRRLSGHLYEASNTRQALGLVWSRDLDIIKQPVLGPDTGLLDSIRQHQQPNSYYSAATNSTHPRTTATEDEEEEELQDEEEEMLILESGQQFLAKRRRARSASGRPSASTHSSEIKRDICSCSREHYCNTSSARPALPEGRPPRRSSSSPFISNTLQQQQQQQLQQSPLSPTRVHKQLPQVYRAKYAYQPRQRDELQLVTGDLLLVMHKCDDGWYIGSSYSTNQMGTFPGNFVELIQ